ncbi:hypothetical protein ACQ4M3_18155 [Leptolyngbya sp. AN03gr2]|uniref:hypothetical protein n=1 Tax=unclassified Leptolyngbya TaxID=2650499 RepID=UPI003D320061
MARVSAFFTSGSLPLLTMPEARKSATLVNLQVDLVNLKSIDPKLDLGDGVSIAALVKLMESTQAEINTLNTTLNTVSQMRRSIQEKERALNQLRERLQLGIAFKYGKDSREHRIVKPPAPKKRKTNSTESTTSNPNESSLPDVSSPSRNTANLN